MIIFIFYYHTMKLLLDLPPEIVREIADYTGVVKMRNGKYMTRIAKTDPRYDILTTIPKKNFIYYEAPIKEDSQFLSTVTLRGGPGSHRIYLDVSGMYYKGEEYINYNLYVVDFSDRHKRRNYHYREGYIRHSCPTELVSFKTVEL